MTFGLATGSAGGTFGTVADNGDGTYSAMFTTSAVGGDTFTATVGGQAVTSTSPTLTVTPSFTLNQTNILSDGGATANQINFNLVNPWGIAYAPGGLFWIADNGTGDSIEGTGADEAAQVRIPLPSVATSGTSKPTGIVYNGSAGDFLLNGSAGSSALFIFATEDGTISGWNATVNASSAVRMVDNTSYPTGGADYTGLALANNGTANYLYAADFATGKIDVFDSHFAPAALTGTFTDPGGDLAGYAPFNIQNLGGRLYVTYAKQDSSHRNQVTGAGNGFVDVFDYNGLFIKRLASQGTLNAPWGLTLTPASFGSYPNDLLVGNFGDGIINVFDPANGNFLGQLVNNFSQPVTLPGLWSLVFGNGGGAGAASTLFFTDGLAGGTHGLFGSLAGVDFNQSTVQANPTSIPQGTTTAVTLTVKDTAGNVESTGGLSVAFTLGNGSAGGTFGTVTDNHNGTYTAVFTATAMGTNTIAATVAGQPVLSTPTLTVTAPAVSLALSSVSIAPTSVIAGGTATLTLTVKDTTGTQETSGGLSVAFTLAPARLPEPSVP